MCRSRLGNPPTLTLNRSASMSNLYYIYAYLREDGTPYYIGKGSGLRAYVSQHNVNLPSKDRIKIIEDRLSEENAFLKEMQLIALYGRKINGTGILRNLTEGGEGASGYLHAEETKRKISEKLIGVPKKPFSDQHKANISSSKKGVSWNGKHTDETRKNIGQKNSINMKGKVLSESAKEKLRGKKWYTDGKSNMFINLKQSHIIPEGFYPGRFVVGTKHTEETKMRLKKPKSDAHRQNIKKSWEKRKNEYTIKLLR